MNVEFLKNKIADWIKDKGTKSFHWLYKEIEKNSLLIAILNNSLIEELKVVDMPQKIYHFYNDVETIPVCRHCGTKLKFVTFVRPYGEFCNRKCSQKNQSENKEDANLKRKNTMLDRYGVEFPMQHEELKNRYIQNSIDKYGVDWVSKDPLVIEKIKDTWSNKENLEEINKKRSDNYKKSIRKTYNDETLNTVYSLNHIQEKRKVTNLELYGNENAYLVEEFINKGKATNLERYGYENAMQSDEIQKKHFLSCVNLKDYVLPSGKSIKVQGFANLALDEILKNHSEDDLDIEFDCPKIEYGLDGKIHTYRPDIHIKSENKLIEVKSFYTLNSDIKKNVEKYRSSIISGYDMEFWIYTNDKKLLKFDFKETKVSLFIKEIIKKYNIDNFDIFYGTENVYLPSKNLILHTQDIKINSEHGDILALKNELITNRNGNIRIINIFSDLIDNKWAIIESRISNLIGLTDKIYARKCTIEELSSKESNIFLTNTHIQGKGQSSINIGLFYSGMLVSVMTFCKKRVALGQKTHIDGEYELLRFSSFLGYSIIGGASKLLSYFNKTYKPSVIITYADKNWSDGNLYENLKFNRIHDTNPNYWYCKDGKRFHRFNFRKDILIKNGHDSSKTEFQIMNSLGYKRVYDCGNIKYELKY